MPYIKQKLREDVEPYIQDVFQYVDEVGDLNYVITQLCQLHLNCNTAANYQGYNEVVGVLECAKQEFYRRAVVSYENIKIKENGDVY